MGEKILGTILPQIDHWGYHAVFLMTFLESSPFVGLFLPGESLVVFSGLLAATGVFELGAVIWVVLSGAATGDAVGYFIGHRFGEAVFLKYGKYFFLKKDHLDETRAFFDRHGWKAVLIGRFIPWLRGFVPLVAGISGMPYLRFQVSNILGVAVWATTFSVVGYLVGNSWEIIGGTLGRIGMFASVAALVAICSYFVIRKLSR